MPLARPRLALDWGVFAVTNDGEAKIAWPEGTAERLAGKAARFRVRTATGGRDEKRVVVTLAGSGRAVGELDIRHGTVMQPFELLLSPGDAAAVAREGVRLRQREGKLPAWFSFEPGAGDPTLLPHLLADGPTDRLAEFHRRMLSLGSIQEFGWMEGCVLDGLWHGRRVLGEARARATIEQHLKAFMDADGRLHYEGTANRPGEGTLRSVETGLPFAVLPRLWPDDRAPEAGLAFWRSKMAADGTYPDSDPELYSAEASYTTAYPLALLARLRREPALADLAVQVLLVRRDNLPLGADLYLRARGATRTYRNWARGYAWYLLGLARTLGELGAHPRRGELVAEFRRVAVIAERHQQADDGLWACYLGEPETGSECAGSAGIAAALAIGVRNGWLPRRSTMAAKRAWKGLLTHLTPDGFLGGASQGNCCGEEFQRSGYRVIYPMAMGLMLQLEAALT